MKFLTPIFYICAIVWVLAGFFYFGEVARWLFESESWWVSFVAWPLAFIICSLPLGIYVVMGCIFYYLAFVLDWNVFGALVFVCPSLLFLFSAPFAYLWDRLTSKR